MTVAAFMELALYHPEFGYYARAGQRSGRAGDFFTSVDVGAVFGELLAAQIAEMFELAGLKARATDAAADATDAVAQPFRAAIDLVEAGAGNGRLSADILRALKRDRNDLYSATRLHLVETSAAARAAQRGTLADVADRIVSSDADLPDSFEGVLIANELLDAMPVHQVVMTADGLKEIFVSHQSQSQSQWQSRSQVTDRKPGSETGEFRLVTGDPSTPRLRAYLDAAGVHLEPGWRAEINLHAIDWIRNAARRLRRGFMILIDYGHEAPELYSVSHAAGTLTTFSGHRADSGDAWLERPGEQDITAHVDWTSVRAAAEAEGLQTIALLDQTYFLLGLVPSLRNPQSATRNLKTLVMPGGLGSVMKVLILGKGVGTPKLLGISFSVRAT
jgi:SAM-dependent MidA family methyltransferase